MVSLVIISTIDLDDWMPGSRAPGLFVFALLNSREKERGQGVGTLFRLDNATLQNFLFTQKRADRGSYRAGGMVDFACRTFACLVFLWSFACWVNYLAQITCRHLLVGT